MKKNTKPEPNMLCGVPFPVSPLATGKGEAIDRFSILKTSALLALQQASAVAIVAASAEETSKELTPDNKDIWCVFGVIRDLIDEAHRSLAEMCGADYPDFREKILGRLEFASSLSNTFAGYEFNGPESEGFVTAVFLNIARLAGEARQFAVEMALMAAEDGAAVAQ